jgi:hypothetical protein
VHEDDGAAAALALRERDLLAAYVDLLLVHPWSFRSACRQVLTKPLDLTT